MARFSEAINFVLAAEGSTFVNDPTNREISKFGLTDKFLKSVGLPNDEDFIKSLKREDAERIYKRYIWDKYGLERITNQRTANKVMDIIVNLGYRRGVRIVQEALVRCGHENIRVDGVLGTYTITALNTDDGCFIIVVKELLSSYYKALVSRKPAYEKYLNGWLARARRG